MRRHLKVTFFFFVLLSTGLFAKSPLVIHSERPLQAEGSFEVLEPFETPLSGFFIRNHHDVPIVDPKSFTLVINGLVEKPLKLNLKDLNKFSKKSLYAVVECSGNKRAFEVPAVGGIQWENGALGNAHWVGVTLKEVLKQAGIKKEARFITVEGADKPALPNTPAFIRSIPLEKALKDDTLLALEMNHEPLPLLHGGPLRLVLPGWYAQNWIKWIQRITVSEKEDEGFYMKKAYRLPNGKPIQELLVQSLVVSPKPEEWVRSGPVQIKGKAFSGAGYISEVRVSLDGGKKWKNARVKPLHPEGGWQEFEVSFHLAKSGRVRVLSRAKDSAGNRQPLKHVWNPGGYVRNAVQGHPFSVLGPQAYEGSLVFKNRCLICHSQGIVSSQKFHPKNWKKTIKKMKHFGAELDPEEEKPLEEFLKIMRKTVSKDPKKTSLKEQKNLFAVQNPQNQSKVLEGQKIYEANCGACHGAEGEGRRGPRLRGRLIPKDLFVQAIVKGKNSMPAFETSISPDQVESLWQFLQRPPIP